MDRAFEHAPHVPLRGPSRDWVLSPPSAQTGSAVWRVDLTLGRTAPDELVSWLSQEERARADRFFRREDRERFLGSHAALRLILARHCDLRPQDLTFRQEPGGKPVLTPGQRAGLHFNLAHSGPYALIGVSTVAPIGVDVEAIRPIGDPLAIARAHFHSTEIAALVRAPRDQLVRAFFRCWTRKEAVVKALGAGLALPLDTFCVADASDTPVQWTGDAHAEAGWSLIDLDFEPDAAGAVAMQLPDQPCLCFRLPHAWAELA